MIQLRNEAGNTWEVATLREARALAREDASIWKISFSIATGERVRLVRMGAHHGEFVWVLEQMEDVIAELAAKRGDADP